ncbi:MAG: N-6 DNA methylase [Coriobacteriia bacterium]|nr:N-6 DNA methylase [Coriobacteriia bacterium]GAV31066.1 predicted helicase [Coriobacteriaceae bacterium EMTCatB1]
MDSLLKTYLSSIADLTRRGDAREESYYPVLKTLLEGTSQEQGRAIQVTVLPKKTEAGNPDFRVWDGSHQVIGYIEAKAPGATLDKVETSEQLQRYLHTFPNLILTDFYEFRLYRQGVPIERAVLDRPFNAQTVKTKPPAEQVEALIHLLETFFSFALPPTLTSEALSVELARRTRFLRDQVILLELAEQVAKQQGDLYGFYDAFKEYLVSGLTEAQFADLYAQTITYGLFAARTRAQGPFNRQMAYALIPPTIGILRDVFHFISLGRPSPQMEVIVDDIAAVLNAADVQAILTQYYRQGKGDDPILHFYETFLAEYDPETRERRGVYYTPQPVVNYIVRAVHQLLKDRFGLSDGLADARVTLLDPAAGTLTFPAEAIRLAFQEFTGKYGEGAKETFLQQHILPHFYAFELMMAPYAIGHIKIGFLLEALGTPLRKGERVQFYLTNTLEMEDLLQTPIPGLASLSEESHHAAQVKRSTILVILGNPPYSGISANQNKWTERLLKTDLDGAQSYYTVDGKPLGERNPKWLQDDYVKFLRLAQWKIHEAGRGVVAMITNHSYLDNPTFRGMRQSLLKTFDEIYILDLHGNSLKRETAPGGGPDENVFDIRQGVAIGIFIKHGNEGKRGVYHADLYGKREDKYRWLETHDLTSAGYQPIQPTSPYYFLIPRATANLHAYQSWPSVPEIFSVNSVGIVTARDGFVIAFEKTELQNRVLQFQNIQGLPDEVLAQAYHLKDKAGWSLSAARKRIQAESNPEAHVHPILYRPFDVRYILYHEAVIERPRPEVMRHMLAGENVALVMPRRVEHVGTWQHVLISDRLVEHVAVSLKTIDYCFPLYLYPSATAPDMFQQARRANLAEWLLPELVAAYDFTPTPEEVLAYIYAVLYSPAYRQKYAAELRIDFPRVPFTADADLFRQMAALGQELIDLHLLRTVPAQPGVKYQGQGSDRIEFVRYDPQSGRVHINRDKYFEGITPEMWNYQIGGYQVLEKYLKDRKGRQMDDPVRYIHIAAAIERTIDIQAQIEQAYPQVEVNVLP